MPPDTGIVHQVNLEYLARVVFATRSEPAADAVAYPDTLVGTDSHTTMINGLGVLGWGVGGIEAEAAMLGQPVSMLIPQVVGFKLTGELPEGATATDLVLTVTQMLRKKGVVGKFVEFYGPGSQALPLADRATIANMAPEYGATCGIFPVDAETLRYLRFTGRSARSDRAGRGLLPEQGLFHTETTPEAEYTDTLELDLGTVEPSWPGPSARRIACSLQPTPGALVRARGAALAASAAGAASPRDARQETSARRARRQRLGRHRRHHELHQHVEPVGDDRRRAARQEGGRAGLTAKPWVKTRLAPGSKVVTEYLTDAGLDTVPREAAFHIVGYGCTTCIGNSGPLPAEISKAIDEGKLVVASVLSGNRNFEGRINPEVRANYLVSPPLVVAYALAGRMDIDLHDRAARAPASDGKPVYLKDIWPTPREVAETMAQRSRARRCSPRTTPRSSTATSTGSRSTCPTGETFAWDDALHLRQAPALLRRHAEDAGRRSTRSEGARVLAVLGDSVTTDHISPAGSIKTDSPAGKYLLEHGVDAKDFNSYGSRRGNHEVMVRGTFANVRLRNQLAPGTEGGVTRHLPDGDADVDLRRLREVHAPKGAAGRPRRQGVRLGLVARLGRQGAAAARRARRSSPRATSASTARTWSAWASCRCSSAPARAPSRSA